jgi:uncharacterized protein (TIGR04255 family)
LRCQLPDSTDLEKLSQVPDRAEFPAIEPNIQLTNLVNVNESGLTSEMRGSQIGHVFRNAESTEALHARLNGFAYGRTDPYQDWETFCGRALGLWRRYADVASPLLVTRFGVRYINRIDAPSENVEIKDYLRTAIDVSPYLPQIINGYFLQVAVPLPRFEATATITSTLVPPERPGTTPLILDIDTWSERPLDLTSRDVDDQIATRLENLRHAKNHAFEACITDATRGLID